MCHVWKGQWAVLLKTDTGEYWLIKTYLRQTLWKNNFWAPTFNKNAQLFTVYLLKWYIISADICNVPSNLVYLSHNKCWHPQCRTSTVSRHVFEDLGNVDTSSITLSFNAVSQTLIVAVFKTLASFRIYILQIQLHILILYTD